jgi:hypothetical protein
VHALFLQQLMDKIALIQFNLDELHRAASNETKSTAGDKHENSPF